MDSNLPQALIAFGLEYCNKLSLFSTVLENPQRFCLVGSDEA